MSEEDSVYHDLFKSFDLDGNGTIDIDELQLGLSKQKETDLTEVTDALEGLLDKFDANRNGVLEIDEFIKLISSTELEEFFVKDDAKVKKEVRSDLDLEKIYMLTPTPEETPKLIKEKMREFDQMLNEIDSKKKKTYIMAQELCPDLCGADFKLAFLRCEVFKVKPAVERWIKYWNKRFDVFGKEKAILPMTPEGAMKGCDKAISSNYAAAAEGVFDPDGRAIILLDFSREGGDYLSEDLLKVMWYAAHVALASKAAQKRGIVLFVKCINSLSDARISLWKKIAESGKGAIPIRVSCMHIISPPSFIKVIIKISKLLMGPKLRNRIYVHSGSIHQILESLSKYGLTKYELPDVLGGNLSFSHSAK